MTQASRVVLAPIEISPPGMGARDRIPAVEIRQGHPQRRPPVDLKIRDGDFLALIGPRAERELKKFALLHIAALDRRIAEMTIIRNTIAGLAAYVRAS